MTRIRAPRQRFTSKKEFSLRDEIKKALAGGGGGGGGGPVDWADITGKPSTFPPSAHSHVIADVTGLQAVLDGKQPLSAVLTATTASFTSAQESKLAGIASGATANDTDAALRARSSHTGTQLSSTISDFTASVLSAMSTGEADRLTNQRAGAPDWKVWTGTQAQYDALGSWDSGTQYAITDAPSFNEQVDDRVAALLVAGTNITLNYNDAANSLTINASGGGSGTTNLTYTASPTNGLVNSDTGTDATLPLVDGTNAGLMAPAQNTKLAGVATGATANSPDATLLARANHTGTQTASTISDFNASSRGLTEAMLIAGSNVTLTPAGSGATRTLTIASTGGGGGTASAVDDLNSATDITFWSGTQAQYNALGSYVAGRTYYITDAPSGGGGGSANFVEAEVDFGSGKSDTAVVITGQSAIVAGSKVNAWVVAKATTDHSADEHWLETISVMAGNIVAGTGFTIYAKNTNMLNEPVEAYNRGGAGGKGTLLYGKFTVQATWG
jgi:hypothetical protein